MESILGRHVLGIAASVLTFVGLILLGVLIYERITDTIKIIFMFLFSGALAGLGVFLSLKNSNTFTRILTGCGFGSVFISVMLTHIYFGRISGMTAFALLLVWLAGALVLARRLKSTSISIVAHIGMAIAICFAYATTGAQSVPLLVYQMVSIAVIVVGNLLCSKKTYQFGLVISLALTVTASGCIWPWSWNKGAGGAPAIVAALLAQFVCASILSWLLAGAANRLASRFWAIALHVVNKGLWIAALFMNVYWLVFRVTERFVLPSNPDEGPMISFLAAAAVGIITAMAHMCVTLFMARRQKLRRGLESLSVLLMSGVVAVLLFITWVVRSDYPLRGPHLALFLLPAVLLLLARRVSSHRSWSIAALCYLALDFLIMAMQGYGELARFGTVALPLGYMLIYLGFIWGWARANKENPTYRMHARLTGYLVTMVSLPIILLESSLPRKGMILLLALTALNAALRLLPFEGRGETSGKKPPLYWALRAGELIVLLANAIYIAGTGIRSAPAWLFLLLFALSMVLSLARVKQNLLGKNPHPGEELFTLAKMTALIAATVYHFTNALPYCGTIVLLTVTALSVLYYFTRRLLYKRQNIDLDFSSIDTVIRVSESLLLLINACCLALANTDVPGWLNLPLFGISMVLALTRIKENVLGKTSRPGEELFTLVKMTALIMATLFNFTSFTRSLPQRGMILLLAITALSIAYHFARKFLYQRQGRALSDSPIDVIIRVSESLLLLVNAICIAFTGILNAPWWLYLLLFALSMVLALARVKENLFGNSPKPGEEAFILLKMTALIMAMVFNFSRPLLYTGAILLLSLSALTIFYHLARIWLYRRQGRALNDSPLDAGLQVFENLLFATDALFIAFLPKDSTSAALTYGLAALAAALAFMRARNLFTDRVKPWEEVFYGVKLTALAMAVVYGQTVWFDNAFVVSLVSMLTALACVVVGFRYQTKSLRLYGLILTLLCVLKLVTYDVSGLDTVLRVVALIGGGIICFLISAIYSYSAKKIDAAAQADEKMKQRP